MPAAAPALAYSPTSSRDGLGIGQDGELALGALEHVAHLLQPLGDVVEGVGVDAEDAQRDGAGPAEVEDLALAAVVIGLHREGDDLEVATALLDDLERLEGGGDGRTAWSKAGSKEKRKRWGDGVA